MTSPHPLAAYLSRAANGSTPEPPTPSLSDPIVTALARARTAADAAQAAWDRGDAYDDDVEPQVQRAAMWAALAQAEEAGRCRRELRGIGDALARLHRLLADDVVDS